MIKDTKVPRTVTSPKKFFIGTGMLSKLDDFVKDFGDTALIVSDEFIQKRVEAEAIPALKAAHLTGFVEKFRYECCQQEIDRLQAVARQQRANVIVGIGGGKTLDTAKAVAFYQNIPVILFPTIASTDAPCTALAVIYNESGEFEKYLFLPQNPDVVGAEAGGLAAAHAINNGMSVVADLHKAQHGEKVVFGLLTQLVLENAPQQEIDNVVRIIKRAKLPLTLKEMGLKNFVEAEWREVAKIACAAEDTMNNMPMDLTVEDVYNAMVAANALGERYSAQG